MPHCTDCGAELVEGDRGHRCPECDGGGQHVEGVGLADLPRTDSDAVRKADAMPWLASLDRPSDADLIDAVVPKPTDHSGSTFATATSNVRVTGDPAFVETVAGLLRPFLELETEDTRLEINLRAVEDRDTGDLTGNFALYLSAAERA